VLIVTVKTKDVPHVTENEQVQVQHLRFGFHRILISYGFKDDPDLPRALELSKLKGIDYEPMKTSYFLGRDTLVPRINAGISYWRELLYIWMFKNSTSATEYFRIPPNRVIELGTQRVL
jgi:KUP system potassium uptake protein